jgi:hypothetical protein
VAPRRAAPHVLDQDRPVVGSGIEKSMVAARRRLDGSGSGEARPSGNRPDDHVDVVAGQPHELSGRFSARPGIRDLCPAEHGQQRRVKTLTDDLERRQILDRMMSMRL